MQKGASDVAYNQGFLKFLFEKKGRTKNFPPSRQKDRWRYNVARARSQAVINREYNIALLFHAAREKNWLVEPDELNPS